MKTKYRSIMSARSGYSGGKTLNNTVSRRLFALGLSGILFISVCALLPSPAQAQCQRWDVSGQWEIRLDKGTNIQVNLQQGEWQQQSANLSGTAAVALSAEANSPPRAGEISGNITDNSFAMKLTVDFAVFRFLGTVGSSGKMEGTVTVRRAVGSSGKIERLTDDGLHWVSSRSMKCADANPPISKQKTDASSTSNAEAAESSSNDTDDHHGKHKKNKNKKKHHHHDDDDQDQGND